MPKSKEKCHKVEKKCANLKISSSFRWLGSLEGQKATEYVLCQTSNPKHPTIQPPQRLWSTIINVLPKGRRHIYDCTFHFRFRIRLSTRTHMYATLQRKKILIYLNQHFLFCNITTSNDNHFKINHK